MLTKFLRIIHKQSDIFNKKIRKKNTKQIMELKKTIARLKNSPMEFNTMVGQAEERISKLKDKTLEIIQSEEKKEEKKKVGGESLRHLWHTTK